MADEVTRLGRRGAAYGFIVCLQAMTWACSSRTIPASDPAPSQPEPAATPPAAAAPAPEPPAQPAPSPQPAPPEPPALPPATTVRIEPGADECALIAEPGDPVATIALTDGVDPTNAPRPSNQGERVLFRQLYETLVRVDCRGGVRPALAASWQLDAGGRTWLVTVRDDARFSDGTPVTAADVRASWTLDGTEGLRPQVSRLVESVALAGDRALAVTLRSRRQDAPSALAHPDLAIAKSAAGSPWPLGTRSSRIAPGAAPGAITVLRDPLPPLRFLIAPGDPRDLLDQGVDLMMTRDRAALDYASTLPAFQSVPLPWQRTHILMTPGRSRSAPPLSDEQRQVLAGDAVRGEARGARAPFWWQGGPDCAAPSAPAPTQSRSGAPPTPRVVYDASDTAARDLAERLVGLVRVSSPAATAFLDALLPDRPLRTYQRATGLSGAALAQAVRLGADAGYVLSVDTQPVDPCRDLQILMEGARWLDAETIVPLVETRWRAVVRRGRSGVIVEGDGGVGFAGESASR